MTLAGWWGRVSAQQLLRPLVVLFFVGGSWVLARQLLAGNPMPVAAAVAVAAGLLLMARTRDAAILWVLLCASVMPARLLPLSAGGLRTDLQELLGLALVAVVLLRVMLGERHRLPAFTSPLLALVLAATFGAGVAISLGSPRSSWLSQYKSFLLYLVPLAFCLIFDEARDRDRLEVWIHRICTYGGILSLAATAAGIGVPSGDDSPEVVTLGVASEAVRLRPPLLTLTVLATLLLTARVSIAGVRRSDLARFLIYGTVIAFSFTRSTWVPLALALVLLAVLRPGARRPLRGLQVALVLVALGGTLFVAADRGRLGSSAAAITLRIRSVGSDQVLTENSYQDRKIESDLALQRIHEHPVRGIGLAQSYGAVLREADPLSGLAVKVDRRFIHNSYLGVWMWTGLPGIAALVLFSIVTVRTSVRARLRLPDEEAARAVAAGLAVLAMGLQASFQTSLTNRSVLATLACALVMLDVPLRLPPRNRSS